jgi:hypothetical protein
MSCQKRLYVNDVYTTYSHCQAKQNFPVRVQIVLKISQLLLNLLPLRSVCFGIVIANFVHCSLHCHSDEIGIQTSKIEVWISSMMNVKCLKFFSLQCTYNCIFIPSSVDLIAAAWNSYFSPRPLIGLTCHPSHQKCELCVGSRRAFVATTEKTGESRICRQEDRVRLTSTLLL